MEGRHNFNNKKRRWEVTFLWSQMTDSQPKPAEGGLQRQSQEGQDQTLETQGLSSNPDSASSQLENQGQVSDSPPPVQWGEKQHLPTCRLPRALAEFNEGLGTVPAA